MATRTTTKTTNTASTQTNPEPEELNLDKKVTVKSIADWVTTFVRKAEGFGGDITIAPKGSTRLSRNEILTQIQSGNRLFTGIDGAGSHATLYIDDVPTRIEAEFESKDGSVKQKVFSVNAVKDVFNIKNDTEFKKAFKDLIVTRAEKYAVIEAMKQLKINDYNRIKFVEQYTGFALS